MLDMYTRALPRPEKSFFLFGPRGTGKTTWLRQQLPRARWFDLLRADEYLPLLRDPALFRRSVEALPAGSWVVVDEVQKLPRLLDEVQGLISAHPRRHRYALSGSSARKLRRLDANLLAGRVIRRDFFPLTGAETGFEIPPERLLRYGCLPDAVTQPEHAVDILEAYVSTYLREEIQQEAYAKSLDSFARFLEIAALMNGQVVNAAGIARDAAVARPTVQRFFETLVDTLIGIWVRPWQPRLKVREAAHPKFYFFDPGVVRALAGRVRDPLAPEERGALLETLVLHELRSHMSAANTGGELRYWRTPAGVEVDFLWTRGPRAVAVEVKSSATWRSHQSKALKELVASGTVARAFGVYLGGHALKDGPVEILPLAQFQRRLSEGKFLPS
jgi:predicted AAA+ superfamily ATPase